MQKYITDCCFAGLKVSVFHNYANLTKFLSDYLITCPTDIEIDITTGDIDYEKEKSDAIYPDYYLESLAFLRKFCSCAADYGIVLFHSCAVVCDEKAYLFTAPSGTGKSTHADLWCKLLGKKVKILNGDKPFIKFMGDIPYAYGSPFDGKEHLSYNGSAEIAGICFLHQSRDNSIEMVTSSEAFRWAYPQTLKPEGTAQCKKAVETIIRLINKVPLYSLGCNISTEAARLSYETMTGEKI